MQADTEAPKGHATIGVRVELDYYGKMIELLADDLALANRRLRRLRLWLCFVGGALLGHVVVALFFGA